MYRPNSPEMMAHHSAHAATTPGQSNNYIKPENQNNRSNNNNNLSAPEHDETQQQQSMKRKRQYGKACGQCRRHHKACDGRRPCYACLAAAAVLIGNRSPTSNNNNGANDSATPDASTERERDLLIQARAHEMCQDVGERRPGRPKRARTESEKAMKLSAEENGEKKEAKKRGRRPAASKIPKKEKDDRDQSERHNVGLPQPHAQPHAQTHIHHHQQQQQQQPYQRQRLAGETIDGNFEDDILLPQQHQHQESLTANAILGGPALNALQDELRHLTVMTSHIRNEQHDLVNRFRAVERSQLPCNKQNHNMSTSTATTRLLGDTEEEEELQAQKLFGYEEDYTITFPNRISRLGDPGRISNFLTIDPAAFGSFVHRVPGNNGFTFSPRPRDFPAGMKLQDCSTFEAALHKPFLLESADQPFFVMRPKYLVDPDTIDATALLHQSGTSSPAFKCLQSYYFDLYHMVVVGVNEAMVNHFGFSREEFVDKETPKYMPYKDRLFPALPQVWGKYPSGISDFLTLMPMFKSKDGTVLEVKARAQYFHNEKGRLMFAIMTIDQIIQEFKPSQPLVPVPQNCPPPPFALPSSLGSSPPSSSSLHPGSPNQSNHSYSTMPPDMSLSEWLTVSLAPQQHKRQQQQNAREPRQRRHEQQYYTRNEQRIFPSDMSLGSSQGLESSPRSSTPSPPGTVTTTASHLHFDTIPTSRYY